MSEPVLVDVADWQATIAAFEKEGKPDICLPLPVAKEVFTHYKPEPIPESKPEPTYMGMLGMP